MLLLLLLTGCTSSFYHTIDGTSTILGVSLPDEQYIQINALSYLGGSKTYVREPASITHEYECWSTNSYFGVIHTQEFRKNRITVIPTNVIETISKWSASASQSQRQDVLDGHDSQKSSERIQAQSVPYAERQVECVFIIYFRSALIHHSGLRRQTWFAFVAHATGKSTKDLNGSSWHGWRQIAQLSLSGWWHRRSAENDNQCSNDNQMIYSVIIVNTGLYVNNNVIIIFGTHVLNFLFRSYMKK